MTNLFKNALFNNKTQKNILVKFKNDSELIGYTYDVFHLMKTEPDVEYILDENTGEVLFSTF